MPLIRCPECSQAYDIPPAVAIRLPQSIANCTCGHWLYGSREALLARLGDSGRVDEIDVRPFQVDEQSRQREVVAGGDDVPARPRSIRVIARTRGDNVNEVFTIQQHPLWIGSRGCHLDFDDPELSIQHCCIQVRGDRLVLRDADSYTGTFLDGEPISEAYVDDGVHLLRAGRVLLCIEPVEESGTIVEALSTTPDQLVRSTPASLRMRRMQEEQSPFEITTFVLVCVEGESRGKRFVIPAEGATVGREGSIRVPDDYLSRKHFSFTWEEGTLRIHDLGSRNGTFLNTLPARNTRVRAGDEIRAGMSVFRIEEG